MNALQQARQIVQGGMTSGLGQVMQGKPNLNGSGTDYGPVYSDPQYGVAASIGGSTQLPMGGPQVGGTLGMSTSGQPFGNANVNGQQVGQFGPQGPQPLAPDQAQMFLSTLHQIFQANHPTLSALAQKMISALQDHHKQMTSIRQGAGNGTNQDMMASMNQGMNNPPMKSGVGVGATDQDMFNSIKAGQ